MKVISRLLVLIAVIMFPIIVNAKESVSITKIVEVEKKGQTVVVQEPTFEGLTINYNLSFSEEKDSITYKATLKNEDKEDYRISNKTEFSKSGYIKYSFEFTDNSNTIKPNETKDMFITIEYYKEVPDNELVNGSYSEENEMNIILVNNEGQIPNPNTASNIIMLIIILSLLLVSLYIFKNHKKLSTLLLVIALLVPITTYALKEIKVTLNTKIEITKKTEFCNIYVGDYYELKTSYFEYEKGMTWTEWRNSSYYNYDASIGSLIPKNIVDCILEVNNKYDFNNMTDDDMDNYEDEVEQCGTPNFQNADWEDVIKDKSEGCYFWTID